jgi:DNA-binding transcriptional LysR family regulator
MDRLRCLQVFTEVARCGSFVRASTQLSLSKSTITKHVAWLEASLGAQLLKRNAKQVALTEAGIRVLDASRDLLERYEAIESEVRDAIHLPRPHLLGRTT